MKDALRAERDELADTAFAVSDLGEGQTVLLEGLEQKGLVKKKVVGGRLSFVATSRLLMEWMREGERQR